MSFLRSGRLCYAILYCFVWFYYLCVLLMEFYPFNAVLCFCRNTLVAMVTKVVLFYIREDFIFCMFCIINSAGQRRSRLLVPLGIRRLFVCKLFTVYSSSQKLLNLLNGYFAGSCELLPSLWFCRLFSIHQLY
jgi:hypothetical protein